MGVMLPDPRAPGTVKLAAMLLVKGGILQFVALASVLRPWWPFLLGFIFILLCAWLLARLNSMAYWFTVVVTGSFLTAGPVLVMLTRFRRVNEARRMSEAGVAEWPRVGMTCLGLGILMTILVLLVSKPSRRAPWATLAGISRS